MEKKRLGQNVEKLKKHRQEITLNGKNADEGTKGSVWRDFLKCFFGLLG